MMRRLYIAGVGMLTPAGCTAAMNDAFLAAGVSCYKISEYHNRQFRQITFTEVPEALFAALEIADPAEPALNQVQARIFKMAVFALQQACATAPLTQPVPLLLAAPEHLPEFPVYLPAGWLPKNLASACRKQVGIQAGRTFQTGRAAAIDALGFVFRHADRLEHDYVLIGGSDCGWHYPHLDGLDGLGRLLAEGNPDGYAPGEGAAFLLLTPHARLAQVRQGNLVALRRPGVADEPGHFFAAEPYRGEGLDRAFKGAFAEDFSGAIHSIYSSMNGEHYWAKELGVAQLRNRTRLPEGVRIVHPAEGYGDLGAATGAALVALAAEHLHRDRTAQANLVYCSADLGRRGALVLEKIPVENLTPADLL